jgi:putative Holliday junction resolvase
MEQILGLDLGEVRTGVAISDALCLFATTYGCIEEDDDEQLLNRIADIIEQNEIFEIVVGYPLHLDGRKSPRCHHTDEMMIKMRDRFPDIRVLPWDERLSTVEASKKLQESRPNLSHRRKKEMIDAMSAQVILQRYLNNRARINTDNDISDFEF